MTTKYTLNLDTEFAQKLAGVATDKGITEAEVIKRALATYSYISTKAPPEWDKKVSLANKDGVVLVEIEVP